MERLTQQLDLPLKQQYIQVDGIGGIINRLLIQWYNFVWSHWTMAEQAWRWKLIVLPQVTSNLPVNPVPKDWNWTDLEGIQLSDPGFDTPGRIDLLLGADIFSHEVLHGQRFGPPCSPSGLRPNLVGYCQAQYARNTINPKSHRIILFVCQGMNYCANFGKWKRATLKIHPFHLRKSWS